MDRMKTEWLITRTQKRQHLNIQYPETLNSASNSGAPSFQKACPLFEQTMITDLKRNGISKTPLHTNSGIFETAFVFYTRIGPRPSTRHWTILQSCYKTQYTQTKVSLYAVCPDSYGRGISFILSLIPEGNLQ